MSDSNMQQLINRKILILRNRDIMASPQTGKKLFFEHKNLESHEVEPYSKFLYFQRYASENQLYKHFPSNFSGSDLRQISECQDNRIKELNELLNTPDKRISPKPPGPPQLINSSVFLPEKNSQVYRSNYKDLQEQVLDKYKQKYSEAKTKENELKMRIKELEMIREIEEKEKNAKKFKAEEYRNGLETQRFMQEQIHEKERIEAKFYDPLSKSRLFPNPFQKSHSFSKSNLPIITHEQVYPKYKNFNRLAVDYSQLPALQQPKFTKHYPKIIPSFPVIGSKPNYQRSL